MLNKLLIKGLEVQWIAKRNYAHIPIFSLKLLKGRRANLGIQHGEIDSSARNTASSVEALIEQGIAEAVRVTKYWKDCSGKRIVI